MNNVIKKAKIRKDLACAMYQPSFDMYQRRSYLEKKYGINDYYIRKYQDELIKEGVIADNNNPSKYRWMKTELEYWVNDEQTQGYYILINWGAHLILNSIWCFLSGIFITLFGILWVLKIAVWNKFLVPIYSKQSK